MKVRREKHFVSLRVKFIGSTILILVISVGSLSLALISFERRRALKQFQSHSSRVSELIEVGLENGMMRNDLTTVRDMLRTLSRQEGVERILVINKKGRIAVSSENADVGKTLNIQDPTCQLCHKRSPRDRNRTVVFTTEGGLQVFRNVNPIANKRECHKCHDPGDKVNGVLITDFAMESYRAGLSSAARMLTTGGLAAVLGAIFVVAVLIHRWVIDRLRKFLVSTKLISQGDLEQEIKVEGSDEITELEKSFNVMTVNLRNSLKEVSEGRAYLENVINSIDDGILVVDRGYRVVTVNNAWLSRIGKSKEAVVGRYCYQISHGLAGPCKGKHNECPVKETFRTGRSCQVLHIHNGNGGDERYVEIYASPVRNEKGNVYHVVEVSRDTTKRKRLENELLQSEKLISMGKLAAHVAHEINNPLTGILTFAKVIQNILDKESLSPSDLKECDSYLNTMADETARCGRIVRSLLEFSRQSEPDFRPVNLNVLVGKSLVLLEHMMARQNIEIVKELTPDPITILGDHNKLQQVFMNIIVNASQAMPEGGRLTIGTSFSSDGRHAVTQFTDTGCGIPEENLDKLFDPFFTTKKEGKGIGLGLSVVYGIVTQHKGRVTVESRKGEGTTFTILLPVKTSKE